MKKIIILSAIVLSCSVFGVFGMYRKKIKVKRDERGNVVPRSLIRRTGLPVGMGQFFGSSGEAFGAIEAEYPGLITSFVNTSIPAEEWRENVMRNLCKKDKSYQNCLKIKESIERCVIFKLEQKINDTLLSRKDQKAAEKRLQELKGAKKVGKKSEEEEEGEEREDDDYNDDRRDENGEFLLVN